MTAILTPALALRHLRELSTDVRAAVALTPAGQRVAGDQAIEDPARALLALTGEAPDVTFTTEGGAVLVAGTPSLVLVVVAGPHALLPLLQHDVATLLADTRDEADGAAVSARTPGVGGSASALVPADPRVEAAAKALIGAVDGNFRS